MTPPPVVPLFPPVAEGDERRLLHELRVHQVELAQQNEELAATRNELADSLRHYVDLYETAPVGLVTVDRDGIIRQINRQARELLAGGAEPRIGQPMADCVAPPSREMLRQALGAARAAGRALELELQVAGDALGPRWLRARMQPDSPADDSLRWSLSDITARRRTQAELAHAREILELSNRIARIGFWEIDFQRDLLTWSAVTCEIHGVPADHPPPLESALAYFKPGADELRLRAAMRAAIDGGASFDLELQITTADGADLWVRQIGIPEMENGRCRRLYGTLQDVDARVQAEAGRLAQARAEAASRSKSDFIARMSHDFRTPLNAVLGFSQLLELDLAVRSAPGTLAKVGHIRQAGEHLLAMVDDVLDIAQIEAGGLRITPENLRLASLIRDCLAMVAPMAERQHVRLQASGTDDGLQAHGDRTRLRQVLVNLLTNAIKYNHRGGSVVVRFEADGDHAAIAVEDTGPGLSAAQRAELFQPFNRLGAERSGIEGTGLGLVIARHLAEAMGGSLQVASEAGTGSVFTVRLARADRGP